jgi:hypothetical protein
MNRPAWLLAAASLLVAVPTAAQSVYVGAGPSFPTGDYSDYAKTGFLVVGGVTYEIASQVSVYGEGFWGQNDHDEEGDKTNPVGVMAGLMYAFPVTGSPVMPYVFGGAGVMWHRYSSDTFGDSSDSAFGYEGGAGVVVEVGGLALFGEGRYMAASFDAGSEGLSDESTAFFAAVLGLSFNLLGGN